jgi:hypothetical protein
MKKFRSRRPDFERHGGPVELRLKELQAVGLFTCLCFLGAVIDLILN